MSRKTTLLFKSILVILKNATIVIPLIEGVIETIYNLTHHDEQKEKNDEQKIKDTTAVETSDD